MNKNEMELALARLKGDFVGTLIGITYWDIPNELKSRLNKKIVELEEEHNNEQDRKIFTNEETY